MDRTRRRGRLGTELGLTYVRVTSVAIVGLLATGLALTTVVALRNDEQRHEEVVRRLGPVAADLLADGAPGSILATFVDRPIRPSVDGAPLPTLMSLPPHGRTVVVNADGDVWFDATGVDGSRSDASDAASVLETAHDALASGREVRRRTLWGTERATPLAGPDGRAVGALAQGSTLRASAGSVATVLAVLGAASLLLVALGTVFGLHASQPLVRRFGVIATAAEAWSRGRFDHVVADGRDDELGRLANRLDDMASRIEELLRHRQELAGLKERTRLAHDLHDSVKQQAFAASMRLAAARSASGPAAATHLEAVEGLLRSIQDELSALIAALRPLPGEPVETWRQVVEAVEPFVRPDRRPRIEATLDRTIRTDDAVAKHLARIAREAVANAVRHADAERIQVLLRRNAHDLVLRVRDDGSGFSVPNPGRVGHGLESIRDRCAQLDADVHLVSARGFGTTVEIRLPLARASEPPSGVPQRRSPLPNGADPARDAPASADAPPASAGAGP